MNIYTFDQPISDDQRSDLAFQGHLLIHRDIPAMVDLIDFSDRLLTTMLDGLSPITAQSHLPRDEYLQRMGLIQTKFRTCNTPKKIFFEVLQQCGVDLQHAFYDHFPMRVVPFDNTHNGAHRAAIRHHRDTWGSNIQSQQNWWAPLYELEEERTIAFYPNYWRKPLANDTARWSFSEYLARREQAQEERAINYASAPQGIEAVDERDVIKLLLQPGDVLNFSSAHLHASVTNSTQAARFSVEMRTVHWQDLIQNREAPNIDNEGTEPMYQWFRSVQTKKNLQQVISEQGLCGR